MTIHKLSKQTSKTYKTETNHCLEIVRTEEGHRYTIAVFLAEDESLPPRISGTKIYEASCDYPEGKQGLNHSLQHFLQTQLPTLCEHAGALLHTMKAGEQSEMEHDVNKENERAAVCREISSKVHKTLEEFADDGDLQGLSHYLLEHAKGLSVQVDNRSKEVETARWVMCDCDDILIQVDLSKQAVIGTCDKLTLVHLDITECLTAALIVLCEIYWDIEQHKPG